MQLQRGLAGHWTSVLGGQIKGVLFLVVLILVVGPATAATAHGNHDAVVLATNSNAGPFHVSVWTPEGPPIVGTNPIAVQVTGGSGGNADSVVIKVDDLDSTGLDRSTTVALVPATTFAVETWSGTIDIGSESEHSLTIVVNQGLDETGALRVVVTPSTPNLFLKLVVWSLAIHSVVFARWLLRRAKKVWRPLPASYAVEGGPA
jgi:hypothetical protein